MLPWEPPLGVIYSNGSDAQKAEFAKSATEGGVQDVFGPMRALSGLYYAKLRLTQKRPFAPKCSDAQLE
jgi:hypothetical protein